MSQSMEHPSQEQDGDRFGGNKQSGIGREECLEELISYTQEKYIYIRLPQPNAGKIPA